MSRLGVFFVPARIWYFLRGLLDIGGQSSVFLQQHTADCTSTIGKFVRYSCHVCLHVS